MRVVQRPGTVKHLALPSLLLANCIIAGGCGQSNQPVQKPPVPYMLSVQDNRNPSIAIGKLTIVFEGIQIRHEGKASELAKGSFHVPRPGTKTVGGTLKVNDLTISESFTDGVNTISFNDQSFKLIEDGTKLAFTDRTVALDDEPQTIHVAKDGTTRSSK